MTTDGVHVAHCCSAHGCKYNAADCPVARGDLVQDYPCPFCPTDEQVEALAELLAQAVEYRGRSNNLASLGPCAEFARERFDDFRHLDWDVQL